ncbi:transketolase [uncultured Agrococcus sp.]|uniref:transketolase n=1 Tax=uncultured Agrococcus sp. TaxID=382258 RepID=UPI0025D44C73|nr:transketolase [uncultured Agrococcus sp.]
MAAFTWTDLDRRAVDTARILAADAVEKVGSGHPGTAMSLAPVAHLLFQKIMRRDPADPHWIGRDRFILSPGHTSLTQYVQHYFEGCDMELDDLKALRTWGSKTAGHPEYGHAAGVEITTGPLGQGLASAVGFAYAQRYESQLFNPGGGADDPFDHFTYVIASDGDVQEGVTSEASSLAGTQALGNLVVIYDANEISIEDDTRIAFTEDTAARYESYGWHVQRVRWRQESGYVEDVEALHEAIRAAQRETDRPSFIVLDTIIGWPSPKKQNTGGIHGSKLGGEELAALKTTLGADPEQHFAVDAEVIEYTRENAAARAAEARAAWQRSFDSWAAANPERKALLDRLQAGELPAGLADALPEFESGSSVATRAASGKVLNALAPLLPELWGGSADLAGSNNTTLNEYGSFAPEHLATAAWPNPSYSGRTMHFGIREHAMASILNGIVLHGPTRAYGGTFLIFSDYQRPALRLAALMGVHPIHVWTHDSIGLGEDGPTHQPVEQLASLRLIPGFDVVRPADAAETAWAWLSILERRDSPVGIALTRQGVPVFERGEGAFASADNVARGAYVLADADSGTPDVILIATGSEVQLAVEARDRLMADGVAARVVSAPCIEWFEEQEEAYRDSVLPSTVRARVSVEAGVTAYWRGIVGDAGRSVGIDHFGASADYETLYERFDITTDAVVRAARESIAAAQEV